MVKALVLETELREIGWHRFNSLWFTGYPPKRCRRWIFLLIHKYPNDFRPHRLRPILLIDIESNIHNKHLKKLTIKTAEELNDLTPEQYGSRMAKAVDIQALNTRLFYDLTKIERIPATGTLANLVSNYYLVVHSFASLSMQQANIPK